MRLFIRFVPTIITVSLAVNRAVRAACPRRSPAPGEATRIIVFRNFTLYSGTGDKPIANAVMIVKDGKIEAVGPEAMRAYLPRVLW